MSVEPDLPGALLEVAQLGGDLAHPGERALRRGRRSAGVSRHGVSSSPAVAGVGRVRGSARSAPARMPFTRAAASSVE